MNREDRSGIAAAQEKAPRQDFTGWTVETLQEA